MPSESDVAARDDGRACHVVKLGGGLITSLTPGHAANPELDRTLVTERARELAGSGVPIVLVHGTGAFGKPSARTYGYMDGRLNADRYAVVSSVSTLLARLELELLECVRDAGLHPLRVPVPSLSRYVDGEVRLHGAGLVAELLGHGITPVIGGNFAWGAGGFAVYSSDSIAVDLAIALRARSVVMATSAPGVQRDFSESEEIFEKLAADDAAVIELVAPTCQDVSGGMRTKIATGARAARSGIPTFIVDGRVAGNLTASLSGRPVSGTRLAAGDNGVAGETAERGVIR